MNSKTAGLNNLANQITAHLKAIHPEKRPVMGNRFRARRVDYCANDEMEVLTDHGHQYFVSVEEAKKWLSL